MDEIPKCWAHEEVMIQLSTNEQWKNTMEVRMSKVEDKVFSPAVTVAVLTLFGTFTASVGAVISTVLIIFAKVHWGIGG